MIAHREQRTLNVELLKETLAHIEAHPEEWDQETWHCGTSYCFAGHAARIANGGSLPFDYPSFQQSRSVRDSCSKLDTSRTVYKNSSIRSEAQAALGLRADVADILFFASNTREELHRIVKQLCELDMGDDSKVMEFCHAWDIPF